MHRDPRADYAYTSPEQVAQLRSGMKHRRRVPLHIIVLAAIVLTCLFLALRTL